jgi:tetratricopeptide (TPR) repeat protein
VILFEMITRSRPFDRNTAPETLTAIIREDHPRLHEVDPAVPAELERIIDRCLQKDPADRYASTRDLARDLREVRDALTNPSGRRSGSHVIARPFQARRAGAIGAAVLTVIVGAYVATRRTTPQSPPKYRSVAVLPFRDLSPAKDAQLFTDGLSEMITTRLAQSKAVRVVSPFGGAEIPETATLKEIADRRGADVLLRGGVQRNDGQLRVTYALLDPNGTQLGGDTVTASTSDLFAAQDLVADSILKQLGAAPTPPPAATVRRDALESPKDQKQYAEALGLIHRIRNDASTEDAVHRLEALLTDARDSALVNAALARALLLRYGQTRNPAFVEQANVYASRAVAIDPTLPDVHVTLGDLRKNAGKLAEAQSEYSKALELRRDYPDALLGLAETYDKMGRGTQAEKTYADVMRISPDWPSVYAKFGGYWYARGTYDKAIENFRRMTELLPDSARGFSNLGGAYIATGKYDAAIAAFDRAVTIDPKSASALSNLGTCHYILGDYAKSASYFERAAQLKPDNYLLWANLGDAQRWSGGNAKASYETAVVTARKSIATNANDALVHAVVASSLAKLGKLDDAKREADAALQLDPTNSDALYHAAVTAHLRGDDAAAIGWLGRAVRAGYSASNAERDPEWKSLRTSADFRNALKSS